MIKVLHVVGGSSKNGAFKGAYILHKALLDLNIDSKVINDLEDKNTSQNLEKGIIYAYKSFFDEDLKLSAGITFYDHFKNPSFSLSSSYRINDSLETTLSSTLIDIQKPLDSDPMLSGLSEMDQVNLEIKYLF